MGTPRALGATATALLNGDVLVAGGEGNSESAADSYLSSAELYDPRSNRWMPTGSMSQNRASGHTATLLRDGRVLVVGGECYPCADFSTNTAEIYNPKTGTWSSTPPMSVPRYRHTATLLHDGRVLIAGGYGAGQPWTTAEIYDPRSNSWTPAGSMSIIRSSATASLLKDGRVLVVGGNCDTSGACQTASTDLYDPKTNTWTPGSPMLVAREDQQQFTLPDGKVMVIGGVNFAMPAAASEVEFYDPASGKWTVGPSTLAPAFEVVGGLLSKGRVLLVGGPNGSDDRFTQMYIPASQTWVPAGDTTTARNEAFGTSFGNDGFILAGGYSTCFPGCVLSSADVFHG